MEARFVRAAILAVALSCLGASYRTANFVVQASTDQIAHSVGDEAEKCRRELAIEWLGQAMPNWAQPCPITVQVAEHLGAGGATSFVFNEGEVFGWQMNIQGSLERVLDSVLPHEVTHTIFASHFRQPLPRWADEGGCTTVEHSSERVKQQKMLISFLRTGRGIPFSQMFAMKDYPRDIMPLYAQGHSLASFLVAQGGKQKFLNYLRDGLQSDQWVQVTARHYGYTDLAVLQNSWLDWVRRGSPPLKSAEPDKTNVAASGGLQRPGPSLIVRGQSPDTPAQALAVVPVRGRTPQPGAPAPVASAPAASAPAASEPTALASQGWRPAGMRPEADVALSAQRAASVDSSAGAADKPNSNAAPARPRQAILEWSRQQPGADTTGGHAQTAGRSVYDTSAASSQTLLR